jgi:hypothetical protein
MRLSSPKVCGGGPCSRQQTVQRNEYEGLEVWVVGMAAIGDFEVGGLKQMRFLVFDFEAEVGDGCRDPEGAKVCCEYAMNEEMPTRKRMDISNVNK